MQHYNFLNTHQRQRGFSLLELLVVVSIIGILIMVASAAYSTAQKRGRDAKRRGDVKAMQSAFEQYYAENDSTYGSSGTCTELASFMPGGIPVDPKGVAYTCANADTAYCICTTALDSGNGNSATADCSSLVPPDPNNDYYCMTNLQ